MIHPAHPPLPDITTPLHDDPYFRYDSRCAAGHGVARLRLWRTAEHTDPVRLAVLTESGRGASLTNSAHEVWRTLTARYGHDLVVLEHWPAGEGIGGEHLDRLVVADGRDHYMRVWPAGENHPLRSDLDAWVDRHRAKLGLGCTRGTLYQSRGYLATRPPYEHFPLLPREHVERAFLRMTDQGGVGWLLSPEPPTSLTTGFVEGLREAMYLACTDRVASWVALTSMTALLYQRLGPPRVGRWELSREAFAPEGDLGRHPAADAKPDEPAGRAALRLAGARVAAEHFLERISLDAEPGPMPPVDDLDIRFGLQALQVVLLNLGAGATGLVAATTRPLPSLDRAG